MSQPVTIDLMGFDEEALLGALPPFSHRGWRWVRSDLVRGRNTDCADRLESLSYQYSDAALFSRLFILRL